MNFRRIVEIAVCRDCVPVSKNIHFYTYGNSRSYVCGLCGKKRTTMGFARYNVPHLLQMEADAHYQEQEINELKAKIKILENHIRYQPGGEGALEALESFRESTDKQNNEH